MSIDESVSVGANGRERDLVDLVLEWGDYACSFPAVLIGELRFVKADPLKNPDDHSVEEQY